MEESQTQAIPNNGASNAADFQPTTQNPQSVPVTNVQQQDGLQGVTNTQELLNDNKESQIKVTSNPAPAQALAKTDVSGLVIIMVVAIIIGFFLFKFANKKPAKKLAAPTPSPEAEATTEKVEAKPETKKKTTKKKSTKKSKRRNR